MQANSALETASDSLEGSSESPPVFFKLIHRGVFWASIAALVLFFFQPTAVAFLVGWGFLLLHIMMGKERVLHLSLYAMSFRGVGLFGSVTESLVNLYDIALLLLILKVVLEVLQLKRKRPSIKQILASLSFLMLLAPSFLGTIDVRFSLVQFLRYAFCVTIFLTFQIYVCDSRRLACVFLAMRDVAVFSSMLAIVHYITQVTGTLPAEGLVWNWGPLNVGIRNWFIARGYARGAAFWGDPNYMGAFVSMTLLLLGLRDFSGKMRNPFGFSLTTCLIGISAIYASKSGTLLGSFVLVSAMYALKRVRVDRLSVAALHLGLAILLLLSFMVADSFNPQGMENVGELLGRPIGAYLDSFKNRLYFWRLGLSIFKNNPLVGIGLNNFRTFFAELHNYNWIAPPHNSVIQLAVGSGVVGLSGFFIFLSTNLRYLPLARRKGYIGLIRALTFVAIFSLLFEFLVARPLWIMLALLPVVSRSEVSDYRTLHNDLLSSGRSAGGT
jgi:O-antigen ligase